MTFDLRRLRLNDLIRSIEHSNIYTLTADGVRLAIFYTNSRAPDPAPLLAADRPPAPATLRDRLSGCPCWKQPLPLDAAATSVIEEGAR
jgi:hypothetical protein